MSFQTISSYCARRKLHHNDPNDWAKEVGDPRYILGLLLSVINVSVQTVELVGQLPKMKFE